MDADRWWVDRRVWALCASLLVGLVVELLTPKTTPLSTFLLIPVIVSATLGRPRLTTILTLMTLVLVITAQLWQSYSAAEIARRSLLIGLAGIVAMGLALKIDRARRLRLLAENTSDVILLGDARLNVLWLSPSAAELLDRPVDDLLGGGVKGVVHPDDLPRLRESIMAAQSEGHDVTERFRLRRGGGDYVWVEGSGRPYRSLRGQESGWVARLRNVEEQVRVEEALRKEARVDGLTGLPNRREGLEHLSRMGLLRDSEGLESAVLSIDIDSFKNINDTHGHAVGDTVLCTLAARISDIVRPGDIVARMGGDEFVVALKGLRDLDEAQQIAERIRVVAREPVKTPDGDVSATVSIGMVRLEPGDTVEQLTDRADAAMYKAKRFGRDLIIYDVQLKTDAGADQRHQSS